jgi:hypothetical protein
MVPFLSPASMDNNDLNPLQRFIAKRELEHKAVAPLERPPPVSAPVLVRAHIRESGGLPTRRPLAWRPSLSCSPFSPVLYEVPRETLMSAVTFMAAGTAFALTFARLQNSEKAIGGWAYG